MFKLLLITVVTMSFGSVYAKQSCSDQVKVAVEAELNSQGVTDSANPFFVATATPNLVSSNATANIQVWAVPFNLGQDGGGMFEVGVVTSGAGIAGTDGCILVSAFMKDENGKIKELPLVVE